VDTEEALGLGLGQQQRVLVGGLIGESDVGVQDLLAVDEDALPPEAHAGVQRLGDDAEVVPDFQGPLRHAQGLDPVHRLGQLVDEPAADPVSAQLRGHQQSDRARAHYQNVGLVLHRVNLPGKTLRKEDG
jgi:hypothetical protein